MEATAGKIKPGATLAETVEALDADPDQNMTDKDAFRDWMQALADETVADLAGTHFDIPEQVRRIDCKIAPTEDGAIYYTGPSEDFTRPGAMWWSVPGDQTSFSKWREKSTVYHEGVPGHHLQIGQAATRSELLNRFQRNLLMSSGHAEGWALYSERLMDELGYYDDDPAGRLGMLDAQAMRAARVVVDIGLHCEFEIPADNPFGWRPGEQWDGEKMWEFMRAHIYTVEDAMLTFERNRYLGWPGQAPSYKVGERLWMQAREDYRERKGADFSLKDFHTNALNLGPMGLGPSPTPSSACNRRRRGGAAGFRRPLRRPPPSESGVVEAEFHLFALVPGPQAVGAAAHGGDLGGGEAAQPVGRDLDPLLGQRRLPVPDQLAVEQDRRVEARPVREVGARDRVVQDPVLGVGVGAQHLVPALHEVDPRAALDGPGRLGLEVADPPVDQRRPQVQVCDRLLGVGDFQARPAGEVLERRRAARGEEAAGQLADRVLALDVPGRDPLVEVRVRLLPAPRGPRADRRLEFGVHEDVDHLLVGRRGHPGFDQRFHRLLAREMAPAGGCLGQDLVAPGEQVRGEASVAGHRREHLLHSVGRGRQHHPQVADRNGVPGRPQHVRAHHRTVLDEFVHGLDRRERPVGSGAARMAGVSFEE
ncbi:hypothetical protein GCM10029992_08230 [Glycomyces albus]